MLKIPFFVTAMIVFGVIIPSIELILGMIVWLLGEILMSLYQDR